MKTVADVSLYLSRLILDLRSRQVWSELARPYEMHRTLMRAFPQAADKEKATARDEFGILFRADADEQRQRVTVYIQSNEKPDWSFLDAMPDYLLADADPPKDVGKIYKKLRNGQVLSFRLRANPTKRIFKVIKSDEGLKGKRVGLLREEEQIAWLIRKGQEREKGVPGGFEIIMKEGKNINGEFSTVPRVTACCEGKQTGYKKNGERSYEMTHLAVRFEGLLRITDADAFRESLVSGIGPAKAFGFGLLSLAPVPP